MLSRVFVKKMLGEVQGKFKARAKYEKTRKVSVRVLDIEWLSKDFSELYTTLASAKNDILFKNELIKILLSEQSYTMQIV